jgi:DNA-directed RNA polymerase subunit H
MTKFNVKDHTLVPKHTKVSEKEKKELLEKYSTTLREFPKILITDPAIEELSVKEGDLVRIERQSATAGQTLFYRRVVNT